MTCCIHSYMQYACRCTQTHTHMHAHMLTCTHAHARTCTHTCACMSAHICMHEHTPACIRAHMQAYAHTCVCTHTQAHTHMQTHACMCAHTHTHAHPHTHTIKNILKAAQVYALGEVPSTISPSLCQTLCCQTSVASRVMQRLGKVAWADGWLVSQFSRLHPGLAIGHCEACEPSESRSRNSPQRIRLKLLLPIWSLGGCWWFHAITVIRTETKEGTHQGQG